MKHADFGVESNLEMSAMFLTTMSDSLRKMGVAREMVNAV